MGMYYVYILRSQRSGIHYVGMSMDVSARIAEHNAGKSTFTKGHRPFELVYQEGPYETSKAREREKYLKRSEVKKRILESLK